MERIEPNPPIPVIRYVNTCLVDLVRRGGGSVSFSSSADLPIPQSYDRERDGELPEFSRVLNRLKVMAKLDPVTYPDPVYGTFKIHALGEEHVVRVNFDDSEGSAEITIE